MKVFAGIIATASANWWPANENAPYCGCQKVIPAASIPGTAGGMINATCTLQFPYADSIHFGRTNDQDPHFVSVASSYMIGRRRDPNNIDGFVFTGYDEVSNPDSLDILVFYDRDDCFRPGRSEDELADLPQHERWEAYNMTEDQIDMLCAFELRCDDNGGAVEGVHLGNFNYDIARSVQTYTVPLYGLEKDNAATFQVTDYFNEPLNCANALAHHGHGTASGCSSNSTGNTGCSNEVTFSHDMNHNGLLEYFQFEPVSPLNLPQCFTQPLHHEHDYEWLTPSPWDTQENFVNPGCAFGSFDDSCIEEPLSLPRV